MSTILSIDTGMSKISMMTTKLPGWTEKMDLPLKPTDSHDEEEESLKSILKEMAENTSVHGVGQIVSARHRYQRLLWLIVVLSLTGYLGFQLTNLFLVFYSHPRQTSVDLKFRHLSFPAISFCNMNAIKKSSILLASSQLQDFFNNKSKDDIHTRRKKRAADLDIVSPSELQDTMSYDYRSHDYDGDYDYYSDDVISISHDLNFDHDSDDAMNSESSSDLFSATPEIRPSSTEMPMTSSVEMMSSTLDLQSSINNCDEWDIACLADYFSFDYDYDHVEEYESSGWVNPSEMDETVYKQERFKQLYTKENVSTRIAIGHNVNDMIISCSYNGKKCNESDFSTFNTLEYGNCYTLSSKDFISRKAGPSSGLLMVMNIELQEYLEEEAYGLRMVIHEPGSQPFPEEEGITLDTHFETSIGIRMLEIKRLGDPHGKCEDGIEFEKTFGVRYTRTACVELCKSKLVIEHCGCRPIDSAGMLNQEISTKARYCNSFNPKDLLCEYDITERYSKEQLKCNCPNPCREIQYRYTVSGRKWPNKDSTSGKLMDSYCLKNLSYATEDCLAYRATNSMYTSYPGWDHTIDNFLRIVIYYEDLNYQLITEEPLYSIYRFIADIGGTLGLFIGASLVSVMELLQVALAVINYLCKKLCCRHGVNKVNRFHSK